MLLLHGKRWSFEPCASRSGASLSAEERRLVVRELVARHGFSERRACELTGSSRSMVRYRRRLLPDASELS